MRKAVAGALALDFLDTPLQQELHESLRDNIMKPGKIENRLAVVGALIVLIAVSSAATSAFGAEVARPDRKTVVAEKIADTTVIGARKANVQSAKAAADAIAMKNGVDLDIDLAVRTSTLLAGTK